MNYTNNVRCDQVKPLERKLFRYLCRQIDYSQFAHDQYVVNNIQEKLSFFKDKYGIGQNMISYYMARLLRNFILDSLSVLQLFHESE